MKYSLSRIGIMCLALLVAGTVAVASAQTQYPNLAPK